MRESDGSFTSRRKIIGSGKFAFLLCDQTFDAYEDVVKAVLEDGDWSFSIFREVHRGRLERNFIEDGRGNDVRQSENPCEQPYWRVAKLFEEHIVYIPLTGVQIEEESVCIGNVTIKEITDDELVSILESRERHFPDLSGGAIERQNSIGETKRSI